ncbi:MAG: cell division protein FtsA [bacterium]
MLRNTTVGIDIGTYQVKVVVTELVRTEGKKEYKIIGTGFSESKGLRHGYIINVADVTQSIQMAVRMAEKSSGMKIHKAYISVGGIGLQAITNVASIMTSRADLEITELDLKKIEDICTQDIPVPLIQNRHVLHPIPLSYKVDGKAVLAKSPLGMKGAKLEIKMLFVTCLEQHLGDLMQAVEDAGITVVDVMASPLAASFVTLSKNQKMAGCVLANIGAETISIVVFENNIPVSLEVFPIGSNDITNDIALGLKIPLEEAESIKIGSTGGSFSKKKLDEIIQARLSDMFELIENHLKKIGRNGLLPAGIFITGGGGSIGMIEDFAKTALKLPSRIASISIGGEKNKIKDSTWAVAYGLCILGFSDELTPGIKPTPIQIIEIIKNFIQKFLP